MAGSIDTAGFADWAEDFYRSGQSRDRFERDFLLLAEARGWGRFLPEDRQLRRERIAVLYRAIFTALYSHHRRRQLADGAFTVWVYRAGGSLECMEAHGHLDGVSLPPSDPFWREGFPPNDWGCSCYVVGARSEGGARRLGGDPDRLVPTFAIPAAFRLTCGPSLDRVLIAVLDGSAL